MVFHEDNELLFSEGDLYTGLRAHLDKAKEKVDSLPKEQFMGNSEEDLIEHFYSSIVLQPITLHEDAMVMDQEETKTDVSRWPDRNPFRDPGPIIVGGVKVTISIPFTGDPQFWKIKPSSWQSVFPRGNIRHPGPDGIGYLNIVIKQPSGEDPKRIKELLDNTLSSIRFYLGTQKNEIEQHNKKLYDSICQAIQKRRERIKAHDGIVEFLKIPLRRKEGAPEIRPIPVQRKLVRPLPPVPKADYKPEPGITTEDLEHILSVIRHEGRTFEATPKTFAVHDEEELRDIILAHLNGHYKGDATGETFRRSGKTDIRIEDEKRAAFVAECKVWRGAKELHDAVDQLLGYLTWRDCKAAIIIFNKHNAKFTELLEKVPEALCSHPLFKKDLGKQQYGEWRYIFIPKEDELRQVTVHVFLFNSMEAIRGKRCMMEGNPRKERRTSDVETASGSGLQITC